ncbi:hypothetical protein [Aquabacterium sp. CECT 9606]|uniref:hypothetical protein n=1 Tax=Aquabacterium sp. CECT 9606 TaxID=2845822 RepID=UPI001E5BD120|nr:hypothetical protein [Aquabacterium sp. CECT 9606]CAH0356020.1 hypothetical protein AQB9606_04505 [Aquabacterium sp. CECT 9606]
MDMALASFEPGTYIEINDTMKGFRKLGLVADVGTMYFDEASETATPFPIYAALAPKAVGNVVSWGLELADKSPVEHRQFNELNERLLEAGIDTITLNRAMHWAVTNHSYDYSRALAAGKAATAQVLDSRVMMDRIIKRAATA